MNHENASPKLDKRVDPKILKDWEEVEARRAEITSRTGGDTRRQAILKRLGMLRRVS